LTNLFRVRTAVLDVAYEASGPEDAVPVVLLHGFPYDARAFDDVVARINPVRFHKAKKGEHKPPMPLAQALTRMAAAVKNFKVDSVSNADLAWVAVGAGAQD